MKKFKNKYRIPSARLQNWNYGSPGAYFITICTKNMEKYFGEIKDGEMHLNELGQIAHAEWLKTPEIRPDMNLELGAFQVMPNHFHGILTIGENRFNTINPNSGRGDDCRDAMHGVSTGVKYNESPENHFGPQSKNLGSIIRGFKSSVTTYARNNNIEFEWQERFHDHIIRNQEEYIRISLYIINNPKNWQEDKFFT